MLLICILTLSIITLFTNPDLKGWIGSTIFGLVFFYFLAILLFLFGRNLFKKKLMKQFEDKLEVQNKRIGLEVKLEGSEFIKLNLIEMYTNPIIIFLNIIGFGMMFTVLDFLTINSLEQNNFPTIQMIFGFIIFIIFPISTYFQAKKNLVSNKLISEKLDYVFDPTGISINSESFDINMKWTSVKSVKELKNWFILYTEKNRGFFIPKRCFRTKENEADFKKILIGLSKTKLKLK